MGHITLGLISLLPRQVSSNNFSGKYSRLRELWPQLVSDWLIGAFKRIFKSTAMVVKHCCWSVYISQIYIKERMVKMIDWDIILHVWEPESAFPFITKQTINLPPDICINIIYKYIGLHFLAVAVLL